jgi:RimJ/RimL family protein N-acetyltransferase
MVGHMFNPDLSVGIGWQRDGEIVCGAAFTDYNGININMHIAKLDGETFPPTFIAAIFDYPFNQVGVRRMTGLIPESNAASIAFAERVGGVREGVLRDGARDGNLVIYGLLRSEADRWLTASFARRLKRQGGSDGRNLQGQPVAAATA